MLCAFHLELFIADATCAFMQGEEFSDDRRIYMRQPKEGLKGLVYGQLLLVRKGVFGLLDAPRRWWRHLREVLVRLGFVQLTLDVALFVKYAHSSVQVHYQVEALVGTHMDDVIGGHDGKGGLKVIQELRKALEWGHWLVGEGTFCGKRVQQLSGHRVRVDQHTFASNIQIAPIHRHRSMTPEAVLNRWEETEFRSGVGNLHWVTSQTRVDHAVDTSRLQKRQNAPTWGDYKALVKVVKEVKSTSSSVIKIKKVENDVLVREVYTLHRV